MEAVEQEEKLCYEAETVMEFTYLGDRESASGRCEADVTARIRYGWVTPIECGELLNGKMLPLKQKGALYKSYARLAILHGNKAWCFT